jgi:SAGA-associated factor 29
MPLIESIGVLAGLRSASEATDAAQQSSNAAPAQRSASGKAGRSHKKGSATKASAASAAIDDTDDVPAAPSPKLHINPRLAVKDKPSRAGSVSATREASVKLEDGAESVASSADGVATSTATGPASSGKIGPGRPSNRLVLTKDEIVFCRHSHASQAANADPPEGEGILCRVTAVIGEGKQRRYEVQDADPSGDPPPPQRASVSQLIQIPEKNQGLADLAKGRNVLAMYPDTTTFYKAEVVDAWRGGENVVKEVRLKFEDDESPREVERRYVLTEK